MDVIPEIQQRLNVLEKRIEVLEDGEAHLTEAAKATGTLAAATEHNPGEQTQPGTQAQPGMIPANTQI